MPSFMFSTLLAANGVARPLDGWQYEYLPYPAAIKITMRSTTAGARASLFTGSETIQEESPVQAGGTIGVTPSDFTTPSVEFIGGQGDRLKVLLREVAGGTPTVDGIIHLEPL